MHIGFQRSGGRGEYEVVGNLADFTASSLEGWHFLLSWPDGKVRDTGIQLESAGSGKPRLRSSWSNSFQIGRMVAALLLLPDPRREYAQTNDSLPIARAKGYVLSRIGFGGTTAFDRAQKLVAIDATFVSLASLAGHESTGVLHRWKRIQALYERTEQFPDPVRALLAEHQRYLATGKPVTADLTKVVAHLVGEVDPRTLGDPLPILERMAGIDASATPTLPPPDEIGDEDPDVSIRSAHEYRLAKARGSKASKFSRDTRSAYNHRCAFCGGRFGGVPNVRSGVDAAHILAWYAYDLDVVPNGITLCKLHHWAFDAAIMLPFYDGTQIRVSFTEHSEELDEHSLGLLGEDGATIPAEYLPVDVKLWPSKLYLDHLYADLAISFTS